MDVFVKLADMKTKQDAASILEQINDGKFRCSASINPLKLLHPIIYFIVPVVTLLIIAASYYVLTSNPDFYAQLDQIQATGDAYAIEMSHNYILDFQFYALLSAIIFALILLICFGECQNRSSNYDTYCEHLDVIKSSLSDFIHGASFDLAERKKEFVYMSYNYNAITYNRQYVVWVSIAIAIHIMLSFGAYFLLSNEPLNKGIVKEYKHKGELFDFNVSNGQYTFIEYSNSTMNEISIPKGIDVEFIPSLNEGSKPTFDISYRIHYPCKDITKNPKNNLYPCNTILPVEKRSIEYYAKVFVAPSYLQNTKLK